MRTGYRGIAIAATASMAVSLMASVATAPAQTGRAAQPLTAQVNPRAVPNGRDLFMKAGCEDCHGTEGRGTASAPSIAGSTLALQGFVTYVRKPAGTMPAQSAQVVTDRNLADIYAFLHSLAAQPAQVADAASGARVEAGAMLFKKNGCYECHANEGQGGAQGPRLGPSPIPFARFVPYVRNPSGDMPPYTAKVLSDEDLAGIYAFLQARPQPPPVNTIPLLAAP